MREVRTDPDILVRAVIDGINRYVREVLTPRSPQLADLWDGPQSQDLDELKHQVARSVAKQWAMSYMIDNA